MNVYCFNYSIVICFSESRNSIIINENFTNKLYFFLLDWGLYNLRARGRLTEFRFGMALFSENNKVSNANELFSDFYYLEHRVSNLCI